MPRQVWLDVRLAPDSGSTALYQAPPRGSIRGIFGAGSGRRDPIRPPQRSGPPGSSPRGRGTRPAPGLGEGAPRFIPARAGNTTTSSATPRTTTVHPRAGGEHEARLERRVRSGRFIPARAGNTPPPGRPARAGTVHPRAGGEHEQIAFFAGKVDGSSPRGRGTRTTCASTHGRGRFIPARAGNTYQ